MQIEIHDRAFALLEEAMEQGGYPDPESAIVAGMWALRVSRREADDWIARLGQDGLARLNEMIAEADADIDSGRLIPAEVAMKRARELIERKTAQAG